MENGAIIIGLGGIGSEICAMAADRITKERGKRMQIYPVAMDTDRNALNDLRRRGFWGTLLPISGDQSVEECWRENKEEVKDWFPEMKVFAKKPMTEGAGQMRIISRLALHVAVKKGKLAPLWDIVRKIRYVSPEYQERNIRVYIISSLAGGTGSGMFLPLAMYLERHIDQTFGDHKMICNGFFLLPSAVRDLASTTLERQSLNSNSYAALKELTAFWGLEDGRENYDQYSIEMELAAEGNGRPTAWKRSGYDRCYVFGGLNREQRFRSSTERIKEAVANALYMQVCSPIQSKNDSRVDNETKYLIGQSASDKDPMLHRLGAVGCGSLIYPYENMLSFCGLSWALDMMGDSWLRYDKLYEQAERERVQQLEAGKHLEEVQRDNVYVNAIRYAGEEDALAKEIRRSCGEESRPAWSGWIEHIKKEAEEEAEQLEEELTGGVQSGLGEFDIGISKLVGRNESWKEKWETRRRLPGYYSEARDQMYELLKEKGDFIVQRIIPEHWGTDTEGPAKWLCPNGKWLHPNAVRYFFYCFLEEAQKRLKVIKKEQEEITGGLQRMDHWKDIRSIWAAEFMKECENARGSIRNKLRITLEELCLERAIRYVTRLSQSYEAFYDNYQYMLQAYEDERDGIAFELDQTRGVSSFYVCANQKCRDMLMGELKEKRSYWVTGSELSEFLFQTLQKPERERRLEQMEQEVREYWIQSAKTCFSELLDKNILDAIKCEALYEQNRELSADQVKALISERRKRLESPLVRYKPDMEVKELRFCCFHCKLQKLRGLDREIVRWLEDNQGEADSEYCSQYELIFYCSLIGIEVHNLVEFFHGISELGSKEGEGFSHYQNEIKAFRDNGIACPHIDWRWGEENKLPDTYMRKAEKETEGTGEDSMNEKSGNECRSDSAAETS